MDGSFLSLRNKNFTYEFLKQLSDVQIEPVVLVFTF